MENSFSTHCWGSELVSELIPSYDLFVPNIHPFQLFKTSRWTVLKFAVVRGKITALTQILTPVLC